MLTLNDGRAELWQWDTGRTLAVDADCSQVHFSNKVFGRSIDVDVADGVAIIPDVLLQTDKDLTAWAFVGTAENGYTKINKVFKVNRRNKPADYVFTPTEQTTLAELVERLDAIEENQGPDAIKNAVDEYLKKNPVDFPVDSVNGKFGDVNLSAEDVGAISQDDLQEATNEALAQAKASGEFDGPQGPKGDTGPQGPKGEQGAPGKTPVRGTDYWTAADKQEIVSSVIAALPDGTEVAYVVGTPVSFTLTGWDADVQGTTYTLKANGYKIGANGLQIGLPSNSSTVNTQAVVAAALTIVDTAVTAPNKKKNVAGYVTITISAVNVPDRDITVAIFGLEEAEPVTVTTAAIGGVTVPVTGQKPVKAITECEQYTGTVTWSPDLVDGKFGPQTVYTATITLTPKVDYKLDGVAANFFTVAGATSVSNEANSGVVTAVFPATKEAAT